MCSKKPFVFCKFAKFESIFTPKIKSIISENYFLSMNIMAILWVIQFPREGKSELSESATKFEKITQWFDVY